MEAFTSKSSGRKSAKERQDQSIMATNNSSIVSKRSVEKIYYREEPGYFRPFVKKFQRRSPLINRGYYLRMRAIEHVVEKFLHTHAGRKTTVVNLGCGYDPLPFRFLDRYAEISKNNNFIDVDYSQLMSQKCQIVKENSNLNTCLEEILPGQEDHAVILRSRQYYAVACDLYNLDQLNSIIKSLHDPIDGPILFVAEVSMTYMTVAGADLVIKWASSFRDSQFCLLEQFLPDGSNHPFAATMLKHFQKLKSPLNSIHVYPELSHQTMRFQKLGWASVELQNLWKLWSDDSIISPHERRQIDSLEQFDEWEEFALFAGHYFLLNAWTCSQKPAIPLKTTFSKSDIPNIPEKMQIPATMSYVQNPEGRGQRRHGAAFSLDDETVAYHGGHGTQSRISDSDIYTKNNSSIDLHIPSRSVMCHTITRVQVSAFSLLGGRGSPSEVSQSHLYGQASSWTARPGLPIGRFRHCVVPLNISDCNGQSKSYLLVFGGKSSTTMLNDWLLYENGSGDLNTRSKEQAQGTWIELKVVGDIPSPRFGAAMALHAHSLSSGFLVGGIGQDHKIMNDFYEWEIAWKIDITLTCRRLPMLSNCSYGRFGATLIGSIWGTLLIGGVASTGVLSEEDEIVIINCNSLQHFDYRIAGPRPLLIGCGITAPNPNDVLVIGGGAVCFSFGTFWNNGSFNISSGSSTEHSWKLVNPIKDDVKVDIAEIPALNRSMQSTSRRSIRTSEDFDQIVAAAEPKILEDIDLGACTELWNLEYLKDAVGRERSVVVHMSSSIHMDFLKKNFTYETMAFASFLNQVQKGSKVYMRSVSAEKPVEKSTSLQEDFPMLADDFRLPQTLSQASENAHSSPLRISGPTQMWLHYDVMANVLCQIRGSKKVVLFPPSDVDKLGFPAGASSSPLDVFQDVKEVRATLATTQPQEALLRPGDVLFIPALWAHATAPTEGYSISINVFFRSLNKGYAAGKDVYGNRDLQAYENSRRDLQRIGKAFRGLPATVGSFYLKRLASELQDMADTWH